MQRLQLDNYKIKIEQNIIKKCYVRIKNEIFLLPNNILSIIKKPVNVLYLQKTDTYYILSLKKLMNRMEKNHECNKTQCRNY